MTVKPIIWRKVEGSYSSSQRGRIGSPSDSPALFLVEWSSTRQRGDAHRWLLISYVPTKRPERTYHATIEDAKSVARDILEEFVGQVTA